LCPGPYWQAKYWQGTANSKISQITYLSFDNFIKERFQEFLEGNLNLYKKITDDPDFAKSLLDALFERYLKWLGSNGEALNGV
jgi:hypothetical protein